MPLFNYYTIVSKILANLQVSKWRMVWSWGIDSD